MADNWQVLDLNSFKGELRFNKKNRRLVAVRCETGECFEYALGDVNIIFIGIGVSLAAGLHYHFAAHDVVVVFCDWKGIPVSSVYPWIDAHGRVAARQRSQAALSIPRSKNAWMRIVKAKIKGQSNNIASVNKEDASRLNELVAQVRSGDPTNREAVAARVYWQLLFPNCGFTRLSGVEAGGKNSLLDYGYSVLRGHSMRAVLSAGLTPALGLFHKGRSNAFALADDFIEPFRPCIDYTVARLDEDADIGDPEVKKLLLQATSTQFSADGLTVPTVMTAFAQQYGRYVEGELEILEVPVWNPLIGGEI